MNTSKSLDLDGIFEVKLDDKQTGYLWAKLSPKSKQAIVEAVEGIYGDSDCWLWAGAKDNDGYGRFQGEVASRYFYKLWVGEIPEGLVVMHKCDTPPCFNPAHLTLGTVAANNADMVAKKRHLYPNRGKYWQEKTHCKHGHEYTAENTLTRKDGRRYCRECDLTRKRKREFASTGSNQVVTPGANKRLGLPFGKMQTIKIAFDVDGTLRCNHDDTCREPNKRIVEMFNTMASFKNTEMYVWSGGGADYADTFARRFGLKVSPSNCISKIGAPPMDIAIDDIQDTAIGKINLIVREK